MVLSASTVNGLLASACHVLPPVLGKFIKYLDSRSGRAGQLVGRWKTRIPRGGGGE